MTLLGLHGIPLIVLRLLVPVYGMPGGTSDDVTVPSNTWTSWCNDSTASTTTSTDITWVRWSTEDPIEVTRQYYVPPTETQEQKRARAAQRDIHRQWADVRIQEEKERKEAAENKALAMLEDLVSEEQFKQYKETGHLVVKGRSHDYVLEKGRGVYKVDKDKVTSLCIHFRDRYKYPETDNTIALMLQLRSDEHEFNRIANHTDLSHKCYE